MRVSRPLFLAGFIALAGVAGLPFPASRAGLPFPLQLEMRVPKVGPRERAELLR
jgi:hypothetical protein